MSTIGGTMSSSYGTTCIIGGSMSIVNGTILMQK